MDLTTEDILNSIKNNNASGKLPMQPLGMPGASHVMGLVNNIAQAIPPYAKDVFERMKRAVTQGPYSSLTGEYDPSIGTLPLEVMMPGYGRAVGLGSTGARFGGNRMTGALSNPQMQSTLKNLMEKYKDIPGRGKLIVKEFRAIHPEYSGSDSTINRVGSRIKDWGGTNLDNGAKSSKDIELGAFGGRGRLNTESPGEAIGRLQEQLPVTKEWVENWAKDANVPIKKVRETGNPSEKTTYMELDTPNVRPGEPNVKVRIPGDENKHLGVNFKPSEVGNLFDTGYGAKFPNGDPMFLTNQHEARVVNQSGMPYANPEALDAALKWRLHKAPHGGNWLVPEEMAPRLPTKPITEVPTNIKPDPNQLKLLSTGFTPYDILKALNGQQNNN